MSKTSETKNKILEMLKSGNKRLMDIYPALGLSPATVSQHLKELKQMGLINELDNTHFKNEKYYSIGKDIAVNNYATNKPSRNNFQKFGYGIAVLLIAVAGLLLFSMYHGPSSRAQTGTLSILLTDPPHVPVGTTALNITYSSVQVHLANSTSSEWISVNSTGELNLMSLINISKAIGTVQIPSNAVVDMVALNITNASIYIGNESRPVSLNSNRVMGQVVNDRSFNGSSALLVDFSPTILTLYTGNSTLFEMVPSVTALMVSKDHLAPQLGGIPEQFALDINASEDIAELCSGLNVTQSSITSTGNRTQMVVTVKDTSNRSITIEHVLLFGNESLYLNPVIAIQGIQGIAQPQPPGIIINGSMPSANLSWPDGDLVGGQGQKILVRTQIDNHSGRVSMVYYNYSQGAPETISVSMGGNSSIMAYGPNSSTANASLFQAQAPLPVPEGSWVRIAGFFNVPRNMTINASVAPQVAGIVDAAFAVGSAKQSLGVIAFSVNANQTLGLLSLPPQSVYRESQQGYTLAPGQSITLTFNGTVGLGSGLLSANFTKGAKYSMDVIGSDGIYAKANGTVT